MQLTVHQDGEAPRTLRVSGEEASTRVVTFGRHPDCDVVLTQSFVSAHHAALHAGVLIEDLGSRNGTFVGGSRIERPTLLEDGAFRLGGETLRVEVTLGEEDGAARALVSEIERVRSTPVIDPGVDSVRGPLIAARSAEPSPIRPDGSTLLADLVREDFEGVKLGADASATDVYLIEAFQFIRNTERIVSKIAGGLTKELSEKTVLPDADKNFRAHMAFLLEHGGDPGARAELREYLGQVFEWLYAAVHCYQRASLAVVEELRSELEPSALIRSRPLPWHARLPSGERSALWERASARLETWNQTHVLDRLEAQVAAAARAFRLSADVEEL